MVYKRMGEEKIKGSLMTAFQVLLPVGVKPPQLNRIPLYCLFRLCSLAFSYDFELQVKAY
jgi:hypothetical protein